MPDKPPTTSSLGRILRLGGLMGRVGSSVLSERMLDFAMSPSTKQTRRTENLVRNATRIVETLGEMKGAAMKVGQMLSLHDAMLPPEVAEVLRLLQKESPQVPSEVMRYELEGSLGGRIEEFFAFFEEKAFAAASIGQVHRATLHDGRQVAVKIQYPLIDEIVKADLKNLKTLARSLFGLFFDIDFEPVWGELRDRLLEELDYEHEALNMDNMTTLYREVPEIVVPKVVHELTSRRVLTMEFTAGIPPKDACSDRYPQPLKNIWGRALFEFQLRGLFTHRLLHADPNLANFAFLEDGRIVVYDFGCVKEIPERIVTGYAALALAVLENRRQDLPEILVGLGVHKTGGTPISQELIDPYVDLLAEMLREEPPYEFGEDPDFYDKILDLGAANWSQTVDTHFPEDVIFIDRSLAGHFGNLTRLRARGPWRTLVERYARRVASSQRQIE